MWNKLSMADRAKYIKLAVENGVTDINNIREVYNSYAEGGDMSNTTSAEGQIVKTDKHLNANNVSDVLRFYYSEDPNDYRDISRKEFEDFMAKNNVGYNDYVYVKEVDPIDYVQPQELPEFTVTGKKTSTEESIASILNNASPGINQNLTPFERYMNDAIADRKIANDLYKDAYYKINGIQGIMDTRTDLWKEHGDALKKYFDPWETGMEMTREFVGDAGWFIPGISQAYTYDSMIKNAQKSIQSNEPIYSTALGMVKDAAFGKLGDMIEIGEALRNPTPENLTRATNRIRQDNKVNTNKAQASKTNVTLNSYIKDILHPKETWKAIREKRYIPFMSSKRKRAVVAEIKKDIEENMLPAIKERFAKKQAALSEKFIVPTDVNEFSLDIVNPVIGDVNFLQKSWGMPKQFAGMFGNDGTLLVGLDSNRKHFLDPIEATRKLYSHEMDHYAQELLGMNTTTPLTRGYLTSLGYTEDIKGSRPALTEWGPEDNYWGIPDYTLMSTEKNEYSPSINHVTNYPTEFNILAEKNTNHTWTSSPREVISEAAGYIDAYPEIRGKLFNELSNRDKIKISSRIARRFNLTREEAFEMLEEASEDGYLANGGKLNLSNKFAQGGDTDEYTPATLAGWVTSLFTDNPTTVASADIASSTINIGSDAIPIVGNIVGAVISAGDAIYDAGKLVVDPSTSNAVDLGTSALGIIPGVGSVKDAKAIAKATAQAAKNVKTTKKVKAATRTVERRGTAAAPERVNVHTLRPDMSRASTYTTNIPFNPFMRTIGTTGNVTDTAEDLGHALFFPYKENTTVKGVFDNLFRK